MKVIQHIFLYSTLTLLCTTGILHAQTPATGKNLGNEDINITKDYQPVLNDAYKINIRPEGDTSTVKPPVLEYKVDPKVMNSNYNITPIKPVRIKDDNIQKLYHGFAKVGYGLENMPLLDVYYNSLRSKNFNAGFHFNHLSSKGKIKDYGFPGKSSNGIGVFGTRYYEKFSLGAKVDYDREVVHFYGYNSPPDLFTKSETRHLMNDFSGAVSLNSLHEQNDAWHYNGSMNFYAFNDNRKNSENNFGITLGGSHALQNGQFDVKANLNFTGVSEDTLHFSRPVIELRPYYTLTKGLLNAELGANIAVETKGIGNYHLYPHAKATYQVIENEISVFAELTGDLKNNSLRNIEKENPYCFIPYGIELRNSNEKIRLSGGAKIKLEHDLIFIGTASFSRIKNDLFYINNHFFDGDSSTMTTYNTIYDNSDLFKVKGSLEYKMAEKITTAVSFEYNNYKTDSLAHPLYKPTLRFGLNGQYNIGDKIFVKADVFYNSKAYRYNTDTISNAAHFIQMKSFVDINLSMDYRYSKLLSVFIQLNNIGFAREYHYDQYPSYRFTGMIGASYSF
jgi:hypothetical protein